MWHCELWASAGLRQKDCCSARELCQKDYIQGSDLWEFRLTTEKWPTVSRQPRTTFLRLQPTQRLKGSFLQITWIFLICSTLSVVDFEYFAAFCIEVASVIRLSELLGGRCKFVYVWGVIGFCPSNTRAGGWPSDGFRRSPTDQLGLGTYWLAGWVGCGTSEAFRLPQ